MFRRIVATAVLAGVAAGIVVSAIQQLWVQPLILYAESFEAPTAESAGKSNNGAAGDDGGRNGATAQPAPEAGHDVKRSLFTVAINALIGIGFGLLLVAGIAFAGRPVDWRRGLLWGLAGFVCFAAATALGLWLMVLARRREMKLLGLAILAMPHVVGAPSMDVYGGPVPTNVINEFIVASLAASAAFWLVLGGISGLFYQRSG